LWLGGVERLYNAGIEKLGVIHRGFLLTKKQNTETFQNGRLLLVQNRFPDLPLIIDPSHITGDREMILEVTQQALELEL
jgi:chorismate mutase